MHSQPDPATPDVFFFFRWFVPPRRSPAWSCAGCFSSSQTRGCSPVPPQFSVAPVQAAGIKTLNSHLHLHETQVFPKHIQTA